MLLTRTDYEGPTLYYTAGHVTSDDDVYINLWRVLAYSMTKMNRNKLTVTAAK